MQARSTKTAVAICVTGLITVLIRALGAIAVFAQDDAPAEPALPFGRGAFHGGCRGGFHGRSGFDGANGANDEDLAAALGLSVEELQAAREEVAAERIAQAVDDGTLTLDQANTLLAMQALRGYLDKEALRAEPLGLSVQDLEAAREDGTLSDLLADITPADLQEKMQTAVADALQRAVADTVITAEQADLVRESLQNGLSLRGAFGLQRQFGRHHGFGDRGGFGGRGFHDFHGFRGAPQADEDGEAFAPFRFAAPFGA